MTEKKKVAESKKLGGEPVTPQPSRVTRSEDFMSYYANNVQIQANAFDMKVIFGLLDQSGGKVVVEQFAEVSMSWIEAKLLSFFLQTQIAAHELEDGKILIPPRILPEEVKALPPELADNPMAKQAQDFYSKLRESLIASNQPG
jgi:hypothetical protein